MVDQRSDAKPNLCDGETPVHAAASEAGKPASRRGGSLALDPDARILFLDDRPLPLGERAISILLMLVERSGQVVSKEELVAAVWPGLAVEDSSLTDQIAALRRVLALVPGGNSWIETLPRRGYRFAGPIMRPATPEAAPRAAFAAERGPARPGSSELTGDDVDAPIPFMSTEPRSRRIVGREAALEMLDRITQHMLTGQRQIAFVTGEAGIGKTAFIDMAMERLSQRGADLLCGRCTERFGTDEAFLPLIDALATRCRAAGRRRTAGGNSYPCTDLASAYTGFHRYNGPYRLPAGSVRRDPRAHAARVLQSS